MAEAIVPTIEPDHVDPVITKSNALLRCQWEIESVYEPRLVAALASRIRFEDEDFHDYAIPITEILGKKYAGRELKKLELTTKKMLSRVVTIYNGQDWKQHPVFLSCEYVSKKGLLIICFNPRMKEHYLQLRERFAQYHLSEFMSLPSTYSQRLFEILRSWDDRPEVTYPLEELQKMLNVPESFRKDFRNFRVKVLERAHRDISERENSTMRYRWEAIKEGKAGRVTGIRFVFEKQTPKKQIALSEQTSSPREVREGNLQSTGDLVAGFLNATPAKSSTKPRPSASRPRPQKGTVAPTTPKLPQSNKPVKKAAPTVETPLMRETRECYDSKACPNLAKRADEVTEHSCISCMTSGYLDHIRSAERSLRKGKEEFPFMRSIPCCVPILPEDVNPVAAPA